MENEKIVAFAGHRHEWHCLGLEAKLMQTLEELFYDGDYGAFDSLCARTVIKLKSKYPHIKLVRILTYYHHDKEKYALPSCYNGSILPELELTHYKQKIIKRNEWIVDHCDLLITHIENTFNSGAYRTLQYAQKQNKPIIYI